MSSRSPPGPCGGAREVRGAGAVPLRAGLFHSQRLEPASCPSPSRCFLCSLGGRGLPPGLALLLALTAPLSSDLGAVWGWMGIYVPPLMRKYPLC